MTKPKHMHRKPDSMEVMKNEGGPVAWFQFAAFCGKALFPYMMDPRVDTIHVETPEGLMPCKAGDYICKKGGKFFVATEKSLLEHWEFTKPVEPSPLDEEDMKELERLEDLEEGCFNHSGFHDNGCHDCDGKKK